MAEDKTYIDDAGLFEDESKAVMFEAAKAYTARGWIVHPLSQPNDQNKKPTKGKVNKNIGKRPLLKEWQKLEKPLSEADLKKWFLDRKSNLGLVCGKASSVIVIDHDHQLFSEWMYGPVKLTTLRSKRTNGRGHIYFKYDPSLPSSKHHLLGVEILSDGNNAVLPPSTHLSGDTYKWIDPKAQVEEMHPAVKERITWLFQTESELGSMLSECRTCFRNIMHLAPDMHGSDGRLLMIAICTDLLAQGAKEDHIKMFAQLMYKEDYDEKRTLRELKSLDPDKTWKCETIKEKLSSLISCGDCRNKSGAAKLKSRKEDGPYWVDGKFKPKLLADEIMASEHFISVMDNKDELYHYENGVYRPHGENIIAAIAQQRLDEESKQTHINEVVEYIKIARLVDRNKINSLSHKINLKNGIYNLDTKTMEPHSSDILSTIQIPVVYDPAEHCGNISKFLCEILPPEDIALVLQLTGYLLIKDKRFIDKAFMLVGEGSNGKGVLLDLLTAFVGKENISHESLQAINEDRFSKANIYGKLSNMFADLPEKAIYDDSAFKMLTGADTMRGERKFGQPFDFESYARLIFSANKLPPHPKESYAWNRRWVIIEFSRKFTDEDKTKDRNLLSKLVTPNELSGLLNLALKGLDWLLDNDRYYYAKTTEEVGTEYRLRSDPVAVFLDECTTPLDEGEITVTDLYYAYVGWAKDRGNIQILDNSRFGMRMKGLGYMKERLPARTVDDKEYRPTGYSGFILDLKNSNAKISHDNSHGKEKIDPSNLLFNRITPFLSQLTQQKCNFSRVTQIILDECTTGKCYVVNNKLRFCYVSCDKSPRNVETLSCHSNCHSKIPAVAVESKTEENLWNRRDD